MSYRVVIGLAVLAACRGTQSTVATPRPSVAPVTPANLLRELEVELIEGVRSDGPIAVPAAFGAGAEPFRIGPASVIAYGNGATGADRLPLRAGPDTSTSVVRLDLSIDASEDGTIASVVHRLSWHAQLCGRTIALPLLRTALFVQTQEGWTPLFEHISAALPALAAAAAEASDDPVPIKLATPDSTSQAIAAAADAFRTTASSGWFGWPSEWKRLTTATLLSEGAYAVPGHESWGYWLGQYDADGIMLRATAVLRKRDAWSVVQFHVSRGYSPSALAALLLGGALGTVDPLSANCEMFQATQQN